MKQKTTEVKKSKKLFSRKQKVKKEIKDLEGNVIKKEKIEKERIITKVKKHLSRYKKLYALAGIIIVVLAVILILYIGIKSFILNKKYGKYETVMDKYGYAMLYTNGKAKSYQKVSKLDLVKLVVAASYNINEVESRGFTPEGEYEYDEWVALAKAFGIIDKNYITKENYDEPATYKDALIALLNARNVVLNTKLSSKKESSFKNLQTYSVEERKYINDAVENNIIEDSKSKLKLDKKIYKGEFNKLLITYVQKYNTVAPEGETLVLKKDSMPSNEDIYPYILYSVPTEVYEYNTVKESSDYKNPLETYKYRKNYYSQVQYKTEEYYNAILNVNHSTIDKTKYLDKLNEFIRYDYAEEINSYVDYVKANQIIIEGNAKVQFPIFYLDGIRYRARVKLSFEIKSSNTDKNVLLGDMLRDNEVKYKNKKYEIYIDAPMGGTLFSNALLLDLEPIIDIMVSDKEASELNEF